jgi:hypothetical protein
MRGMARVRGERAAIAVAPLAGAAGDADCDNDRADDGAET